MWNLLSHLSEYGTLTDDDILQRSTNENGLDTCELFSLTTERDFCKSVSDDIINSLYNLNIKQ